MKPLKIKKRSKEFEAYAVGNNIEFWIDEEHEEDSSDVVFIELGPSDVYDLYKYLEEWLDED